MAHIGRGVAVDAGAPMTAAYGADGHSHQRGISRRLREPGWTVVGRAQSCAKRLFHAITVAGRGLMTRNEAHASAGLSPQALQVFHSERNYQV